MTEDYYLVVKTGQAEIRAIRNTAPSTLKQLFPIIELTRGRKKTLEDKSEVHPFDSRLDVLKEVFAGMDVAIDATGDTNLTCTEIDRLYDYNNGYENWVTLVRNLKAEKCFSSIVPTLLLNFDDNPYEDNVKKEIEELCKDFDTLMYRDTITDDYCYEDLPLIINNLPEGKNLIILIDCGYAPQAIENSLCSKLLARIANLKKSILDGRCKLAFCATSFPNNISEIGGQHNDSFKITEVNLYNRIREKYDDVAYGDYGSINPIRNDNVVMARGWIPRIDVPLSAEVFYHRRRRVGAAYSETYKQVARIVMADAKFPTDLDCWGCDQIRVCTTLPPSSSPNYWISVRMNIHIEQQVRRLTLVNDI